MADVAPRAGAWVGTFSPLITSSHGKSRTPCGCVGWNSHDQLGRLITAGRTPCGCVGWNRSRVTAS